MVKGILFDVDGTLVLSNDAHAKAWQEAFSVYGYEIEFDSVRRLIGMGSDKLISTLESSLSSYHGKGKEIKEKRQEIFLNKYVKDLKPCNGSRDLVVAVKQISLKTMVASSASEDELKSLLKSAHVDDLLTEATTSDDVNNSKPDPDIINVALQKIGLQSNEVVMIGDTPYDIEAAAKAGVKCIALLSGGWEKTSLQGSLEIYKDPADLLAHRSDFGL